MNTLSPICTRRFFRDSLCLKKLLQAKETRYLDTGSKFFALPASTIQQEVAEYLDKTEINTLFDAPDACMMKKSARTSAALFSLPNGQRVFFKRNGNRKGLRFSLFYLTHFPRSFRAAGAAIAFRETGVRTPEVFAAGEERRGMILKNSFLLTEAVGNGASLLDEFYQDTTTPEKVALMLEETITAAAKLHRANIYHGDLKLINFYRPAPDAEIGIWDLDSVRIYRIGIPRKRVIREIGRIVTSFLIFGEEKANLPDSFFDLHAMTEKALSIYGKAYPAGFIPSAHAVEQEAISRWLSKKHLQHQYGENLL